MSELRTEETMREESQDDRGPASRLGIAALARDATIYGGTRVLLKSLAFLLVPLYAAFLSPTQFGILEIVIATIAVVDVLIAANMDGVFMRFYFDRDDSAWRRQIISTYLVIETIYPAVVVGTLIGFSGVISDRIFGTSAYSAFFVIALIDVYLTNVVDLPMMLCRVRRKPYTFAAYSLARGLVQIVASVLLVAVFEVGVKGILIASLCSVCFAFLITLREYVRDLTRVTEWRLAREMVSFAWPGIIGGLSFYALNLMDRFFVKHYHGLADSGLYGAAFRYSQVVLVAVLAFRLGWTSWHYGWLNSGRHEQMVARGANYYFFATGFLAVLVSAWILPVFHVAMPTRYWDATPAVAPLALAAVATGAYNIFAVGFNVKKRMRLVPLLAVGGALVAVGLYFVLIPPYSFQGAAWATAASFAVLALATALVAHRIYPVPWDRYRILLAATAALGLCLASLIVDDAVSISTSIPLRLAITAAFPLLLFAFRFFPPGDLAAARAHLRRLAPG